MAKRKKRGGSLAMTLGDLAGRVAYCFKAPPGLTRRGKPVTKVCMGKQYGKNTTVQIGPRAKVSTAYINQIGRDPGTLTSEYRGNIGPARAAIKTMSLVSVKGRSERQLMAAERAHKGYLKSEAKRKAAGKPRKKYPKSAKMVKVIQ